MAIVPYQDLLAYIQPQVPAASIAIITQASRKAVKDFCRRSTAFRAALDPIPGIAGVPYYDLPTPPYTQVSEIITASYNDYRLTPGSDVLVVSTNTPGTPAWAWLVGQQLKLTPAPTSTQQCALKVVVAVEPTRAATGVDSIFFDTHYDSFVMGALADLLSMANQAWSNPGLAQSYLAQFERAIMLATGRANLDNTAKLRVTPYGGL